MLTAHDIRMNRYVLSMRRENLRFAIKSVRHYRKTNDRSALLDAMLNLRAKLEDYRRTAHVLIPHT